MPSRNIIKTYTPKSFYHIYNRGVNKQIIFEDHEDNMVFLSLFDRYLNPNTEQLDSNKLPYQKYPSIELNAYCLMKNHFHILVFVKNDESELPGLMRSIGTSYTSYFNKKYERVGPLFQSRYKAVQVDCGEQLAHLTRYIHLNPENYLQYPYSSLNYYLGNRSPEWLKPELAIQQSQVSNYLEFLKSA